MNAADHSITVMLFHDRTPLAWLTVATYFVGAAVAWLAGRSARRRDRRFWTMTALLLLILGLNKELDLQALLTTEARRWAHYSGWYDQRRLVQGLFLLGLGVAVIASAFALAAWLRRSPISVKAAGIGIVLIFTFVVMRAGSFHHMDNWVTVDLAGMRSGWWLELAGILVIAFSALTYRMRSRQQ